MMLCRAQRNRNAAEVCCILHSVTAAAGLNDAETVIEGPASRTSQATGRAAAGSLDCPLFADRPVASLSFGGFSIEMFL
jgi:hypothetical protein